jgi:hypothetical protein
VGHGPREREVVWTPAARDCVDEILAYIIIASHQIDRSGKYPEPETDAIQFRVSGSELVAGSVSDSGAVFSVGVGSV